MSDCILDNRPPSIRDSFAQDVPRLAHAILCGTDQRGDADVALACPARPARRRRHNSSRRKNPTSSSSWATTSASCSRASTIAA